MVFSQVFIEDFGHIFSIKLILIQADADIDHAAALGEHPPVMRYIIPVEYHLHHALLKVKSLPPSYARKDQPERPLIRAVLVPEILIAAAGGEYRYLGLNRPVTVHGSGYPAVAVSQKLPGGESRNEVRPGLLCLIEKSLVEYGAVYRHRF